jgi:hypothetical protein
MLAKLLVARLAACAGAARVHHTADRRCIAFLELPLAARGKEKRKDLTFSFPPGFERNVSRSLRKAAGFTSIIRPSGFATKMASATCAKSSSNSSSRLRCSANSPCGSSLPFVGREAPSNFVGSVSITRLRSPHRSFIVVRNLGVCLAA